MRKNILYIFKNVTIKKTNSENALNITLYISCSHELETWTTINSMKEGGTYASSRFYVLNFF